MSNSEKPSVPTSSNYLPFPSDTLLIHYFYLASDPLTRLEVAVAIGQLLEGTSQSYSLTSLASSPASILALRTWLNGDQPSRFWRTEGNIIVTQSPCKKHIVIGTRHLLHDLTILMSTPHPPRLADLDLMWKAAIRLTEEPNEGEIAF